MSEDADFRMQLIIEAITETVNETINEMVGDIMSYKSISYGEAIILTLKLLSNGITPKSDEFYECMDNVKTLWEV